MIKKAHRKTTFFSPSIDQWLPAWSLPWFTKHVPYLSLQRKVREKKTSKAFWWSGFNVNFLHSELPYSLSSLSALQKACSISWAA